MSEQSHNFAPVSDEVKRQAAEIAQVLRENILGDWKLDLPSPKDDILPPVHELSRFFGASPTTIRRAERVLAESNLVVISPGRRTRITKGPKSALTEITHEITSIIHELDKLRDRIIAIESLVDPHVRYTHQETPLAELD